MVVLVVVGVGSQMTKKQIANLKCYIAQTIAQPNLSTIKKIDKAIEYIDKITSEVKR